MFLEHIVVALCLISSESVDLWPIHFVINYLEEQVLCLVDMLNEPSLTTFY